MGTIPLNNHGDMVSGKNIAFYLVAVSEENEFNAMRVGRIRVQHYVPASYRMVQNW